MTLDRFFTQRPSKKNLPPIPNYIFREKYNKYQDLWIRLLHGKVFKSKRVGADYFGESYQEFYPSRAQFNLQTGLKNMRRLVWTKLPYSRPTWGNTLHYLMGGKNSVKPGIAHWMIRCFSSRDMTILDPFPNLGTIILEAGLLGRRVLGINCNPLENFIINAKIDQTPIQTHLEYLREVSDAVTMKSSPPDNVPESMRGFFHPNTLTEIVMLGEQLLADKMDYLFACLMQILIGNRPKFLSRPERSEIAPYRAVIPRVANCAIKYLEYQRRFTKQIILLNDRDEGLNSLANESVDVIISAPLRKSVIKNQRLVEYFGKFPPEKSNLGLMESTEDLARVLKPGSYCFLIFDLDFYLDKISAAFKRAGMQKIALDLGDWGRGNSPILCFRKSK